MKKQKTSESFISRFQKHVDVDPFERIEYIDDLWLWLRGSVVPWLCVLEQLSNEL